MYIFNKRNWLKTLNVINSKLIKFEWGFKNEMKKIQFLLLNVKSLYAIFYILLGVKSLYAIVKLSSKTISHCL